ncbi:UDP-glucose--hexose-1-phosphate uridylyltransferase [Alkaliphilus peptidifermentans]|uniref:Galactose-1-phosphate uridylyltransferase n=1 Tax=Alkaliphilus peptidifermentans DSM 18978 TaxID=1120976 RepID=A0A1G5L5U3_9FIRM|nr:UDP-glucose--hexose-1-phosphate uridylyltransferase [Alkaliphilus peptidifermentans]SCZ08235.1 UDPglucose--hexose-1-phosphate uridylyltransferase [Alkaliphilus peptidifermentans DSM 18978]
MNIYKEIKRLVNYGIRNNLVEEADAFYRINKILEVLDIDDFVDVDIEEEVLDNPQPILDNLLDYAFIEKKLMDNTSVNRDLLDTKLMDCIMPLPSQVISKFYEDYNVAPTMATENYYKISLASNYIRQERIKKDISWEINTEYGSLDITINLSKPEKDPKAIAMAKEEKSMGYPKCLLCRENEGYRGRINHPARQNHRIIPLTLNNEKWYYQFSPYVYYNQHAIIFKGEHEPMKICRDTFTRLLEFVEKFPHYFIGANADLPIVGGSILSHDHFQGGNHRFPMEKAPLLMSIKIKGFDDVETGIVKWPLSVIRIRSKSINRLIDLSEVILDGWRNYCDREVDIIPCTKDEPHNTITPIARFKDNKFEIDLVLRNNRTNEKHPLGIFHPHSDLHHIKKENIGLIEVMGLAVLPSRLKRELSIIKECLQGSSFFNECEGMENYEKWFMYLKEKYCNPNNNFEDILKYEVGKIFERILLDAGVFKQSEIGINAFKDFLNSI